MNKPYLQLQDYSVTQEEFHLVYNSDFDLLETHPKPSLENLPYYYKSENYISHTDGKRNLFERLYQFVKQITLSKKLKLISSLKTPEKFLLDVGCGTGDFLKVAGDDGWKIFGIEPNDDARSIANNKINGAVIHTSKIPDLKIESFDVITLWHVLEHLPDFEDQVSLYKKLLKPDGFLIIAVPNFKSYDALKYGKHWAAYDVPRHLYHFSQNSIKKLSAKLNFQLKQILPMKFDAYYVALLSEKYKFGKMNFLRATWSAWQSNMKAKRSGEYSSLIYVLKK